MSQRLLPNLTALLLLPANFLVADTVMFVEGETKIGKIRGLEHGSVVLSIQPVPGFPSVEVRIPKPRVAAIAFAPDEQRDAFLQSASHAQLPEVEKLWHRFAPLLSVQGSPAARIGLRYGALALEIGNESDSTDLVSLFQNIAANAPTIEEQEAAKQGTLRALLRHGRWAHAESEALAITKAPCGAALLAEARLTVGLVQQKRLRSFFADNPKWKQDEFARLERDRLHNEALDSLLGAALLPGAPGDLAARARLAAMEIYDAAGERQRASTFAEEIIEFHSGTSEARSAQEWLRACAVSPDIRSK